jgi:hypothetical protein
VAAARRERLRRGYLHNAAVRQFGDEMGRSKKLYAGPKRHFGKPLTRRIINSGKFTDIDTDFAFCDSTACGVPRSIKFRDVASTDVADQLQTEYI